MTMTIAPMQEHLVQTNLTVAAASASYLKAMLLPQTASFNFTLQVYSPQAFHGNAPEGFFQPSCV